MDVIIQIAHKNFVKCCIELEIQKIKQFFYLWINYNIIIIIRIIFQKMNYALFHYHIIYMIKLFLVNCCIHIIFLIAKNRKYYNIILAIINYLNYIFQFANSNILIKITFLFICIIICKAKNITLLFQKKF